MNAILRGVRVIDPAGRLDAQKQDVWLDAGRIIAIYHHIDADGVPVIDLTPAGDAEPCVLCPGFIDLHAHLRDPGDVEAETYDSGGRAAAAGGYTHVVAMANTRPAIDNAERVALAISGAAEADATILQVAALTVGLDGEELVDIERCADAGAVAFSDDGRNAVSPRLLSVAIARAAASGHAVLLHPEHEEAIALANAVHGVTTRCPIRPPESEISAAQLGIRALAHAGTGRLHLQHVSCAATVEAVMAARDQGLAITAEVTPHHLSMWLPVESEPDPPSLLKVNPPLRTERDRTALVHALREGVIDAVATDHAPHRASEKTLRYADAAPGMIGLDTALAVCLTLGAMGGQWMPTLVERLTVGPHRVLGSRAGLTEPRLRIGEAATCTLFDPSAEWTVTAEALHSKSRNTPLLGTTLRGRVLLTLDGGRVTHRDAARIPIDSPVAERV